LKEFYACCRAFLEVPIGLFGKAARLKDDGAASKRFPAQSAKRPWGARDCRGREARHGRVAGAVAEPRKARFFAEQKMCQYAKNN
jgi:hypothetical protein